MSLDPDKLAKALRAYWGHRGNVPSGVETAIETYLTEMFKPGQLVVGEPIEPVRDYRKELWIDVATEVARCEVHPKGMTPAYWANHTLEAFDTTFSKEQNHG